MYTIAETIKEEIARALITQAAPGWDTQYQGEWYAVDTDGDGELDEVMHAEATRQWNPWHDNAVAIPVDACVDWSDRPDFELQDGDDMDDQISFVIDYLLSDVDAEEVE